MSNALTATTLSAAATARDTVISVTSATGIVAPTNNISQQLYLINPDTTMGELMNVVSISGTQITVARLSEYRQAFASGSAVVIGFSPANPWQGSGFFNTNPYGTLASGSEPAVPYINVVTGEQWLRSLTGVWVPGWNTPTSIKGVTTAVASANGAILPSGPLFHVTGTNTVTSFTVPVGFAGGSFQTINDAAWQTTAGNNIGSTTTAVATEVTTWVYDSDAGKFYASVGV